MSKKRIEGLHLEGSEGTGGFKPLCSPFPGIPHVSSRPNLDVLYAHGFCKENGPGACAGCAFDFEYEGQLVTDTPYPACEVLSDILLTAKKKVQNER